MENSNKILFRQLITSDPLDGGIAQILDQQIRRGHLEVAILHARTQRPSIGTRKDADFASSFSYFSGRLIDAVVAVAAKVCGRASQTRPTKARRRRRFSFLFFLLVDSVDGFCIRIARKHMAVT